MANVESKQFRYTLEQVVELAKTYTMNGKSLSKALIATPWPCCSFTASDDCGDAIFLIELLEDIDRIANGKSVRGPLAFNGNADWVIAVNGIVNP